jgi:hypothetical protein
LATVLKKTVPYYLIRAPSSIHLSDLTFLADGFLTQSPFLTQSLRLHVLTKGFVAADRNGSDIADIVTAAGYTEIHE